jgi:hypothetical protein
MTFPAGQNSGRNEDRQPLGIQNKSTTLLVLITAIGLAPRLSEPVSPGPKTKRSKRFSRERTVHGRSSIHRHYFSAGLDADRREILARNNGTDVAWVDFDQDGLMDLFLVHRKQSDGLLLMFRNQGKGLLEKVSGSLGPDFMRPVAGRGLATADFDNDGNLDVALNNRSDLSGAIADR